jgi:membrane protein implicated in regulation of membrane protease activity
MNSVIEFLTREKLSAQFYKLEYLICLVFSSIGLWLVVASFKVPVGFTIFWIQATLALVFIYLFLHERSRLKLICYTLSLLNKLDKEDEELRIKQTLGNVFSGTGRKYYGGATWSTRSPASISVSKDDIEITIDTTAESAIKEYISRNEQLLEETIRRIKEGYYEKRK